MARKDKNQDGDIFGLPGGQASKGDDRGLDSYQIRQLMPAIGWAAVFQEAEDSEELRLLPLACFGLVEIAEDDKTTSVVRPLAADPLGRIDDVEAFDDFLCLLPPGVEPGAIQAVIDAAWALRREEEEEEESKEGSRA